MDCFQYYITAEEVTEWDLNIFLISLGQDCRVHTEVIHQTAPQTVFWADLGFSLFTHSLKTQCIYSCQPLPDSRNGETNKTDSKRSIEQSQAESKPQFTSLLAVMKYNGRATISTGMERGEDWTGQGTSEYVTCVIYTYIYIYTQSNTFCSYIGRHTLLDPDTK